MPFSDIQVLARCPLFAELPADDLEALAAVAHRRKLVTGETLFFAAEPAQGMQIVVSGRVKVFVVSPATGREVILTVERPFGTVAELVALDGGEYPASAEAAEPSELLILEQEGFQQVLHDRPGVALHLMRMLGRRLRRLVGLLEALSFQEVVHRLAAYLLGEARKGLPFALATNAEIAAQLGTVPELVSRHLSRLLAGEVISMNGRTVVGIDGEQLEEMARSAGR